MTKTIIVTFRENITEAEHAEFIHLLEGMDCIEEYEELNEQDESLDKSQSPS